MFLPFLSVLFAYLTNFNILSVCMHIFCSSYSRGELSDGSADWPVSLGWFSCACVHHCHILQYVERDQGLMKLDIFYGKIWQHFTITLRMCTVGGQ